MAKGTPERRLDIPSRVKAHPIIAILVLLGVATSGVAAFVSDFRSVGTTLACIPFDFGLSAYEGSASIVTRTPEFEWRMTRVESTLMGTENHHCESDCRGEPTRTNYEIDLNISGLRNGIRQELRNPQLTCVSGPCDGWNDIMSSGEVSESGLEATASFDVWSMPTTWRLSADVYENQIGNWATETIDQVVSTDRTFEIIVPNLDSSVRVRGRMDDGTQFEFEVGHDDETGIFTSLTREVLTEGVVRYPFSVGNPRCETS